MIGEGYSQPQLVTGKEQVKSTSAVKVLVLVAVAVHLFLALNTPMFLIANGIHDDSLYMKSAAYMLSGQWLGPYTELTLQKGIGAPMFIAVATASGLPYHFVVGLVYLLGLGVALMGLRALGFRASVLRVIFVLGALSTAMFDASMMRIVREQALTVLSLGVLGLSFLGLAAVRARRSGAGLWFVGAGLLWGWHWVTREESVWFLPGMLLLGVVALMVNRSGSWIRRWMTVLCLPLGLVIVLLSNAFINYKYYGIFIGLEVWQEEFKEALGATARVLPKHWDPKIPAQRSNFPKIAEVSPTFAEISPLLPSQPPDACCHGEYTPGLWMCAIRTAFFRAGYYESPEKARAAYARMANEINSACNFQKIDCLPQRSGLIPQLTAGVAWAATIKAFKNVMYVLDPRNIEHEPLTAEGSVYQRTFFGDMVRTSGVPSRNWTVARLAVSGPVNAEKVESITTEFPIVVDPHSRSSDLSFPSLRLEVQFDSRCDGCRLILFSRDGRPHELHLSKLVTMSDEQLFLGPLTVSKELMVSGASNTILPSMMRGRVAYIVLHVLRSVVGWMAAGVGILGLLGGLILMFFAPIFLTRQAWNDWRIWFVGVIPIMVLARLWIFALVEVTSFSATSVMYFSPVYPLMVVQGAVFWGVLESLLAHRALYWARDAKQVNL